MNAGDTLIRRQIAVTTGGAEEIFTLHDFPSGRFLEGPFDSAAMAIHRGLKRASVGELWLEKEAGSNVFHLIST